MARKNIRLDESDILSLPATVAISWLLRNGAFVATPGALLGELCNQLTAEGLAIASATLSIANLDPVVSRSRLRWLREDGSVVEHVLLHGMSFDGGETPTNNLKQAFAGTEHEIEWAPERPHGFTAEEREYLDAICGVMAAPLHAVVERELTRGLLRAYLGRRSADKVLSGHVRRGVGEVIEAVIWVSDLRDFTLLGEAVTPDQLVVALNDCCARLVGAIHPFGGEVLKFIGDGVLAIFPIAGRGLESACDAAIAAVRAAREGMATLSAERQELGFPSIDFGIGLHIGEVIYGNIGSPDRLDFTAIGTAVNRASRIEGLCRQVGCPVLISSEVASRCLTPLVDLGAHPLRGGIEPVTLYTLPELVLKLT